jgi:hypothetical protein
VDDVPPTDNMTPVTILPVDDDQVDEVPRSEVIDGVRNVILFDEQLSILKTFSQALKFFKAILIELLLQSLENPYPVMYIAVPPAIDPYVFDELIFKIEVLKKNDADEEANPSPDTKAESRWKPPTTF